MNKRLVFALVLIGLTVIVLIVSGGEASVNLLATRVKTAASFVYLGFVVVGVLIGMLIK